MLLWNYSVIHKSPWRFRAGIGAICDNSWTKNGSLRAIHTSSSSPKLWWLPTGYWQNWWMLPRVAGYVVGFSEMSLGSQWNAVLWINADWTIDIVSFGNATLSLVASWTGSCSIQLWLSWDIVWAIFWSGNADISVTGAGTLWWVALLSWASTISLIANAELFALWHLSGIMTPFTELSPQWLAQAVWLALANDNNVNGTMWAKLNTASSGWVDLNALAQAVWQYGVRSLTTSGWLTTEQAEQLAATFKKGDVLINLEDILISPS